MTRYFPLSACLALLACGSPAQQIGATNLTAPEPSTASAAPAPPRNSASVSGDKADGAPLKIALSDGRSVGLRGFKVDRKQGLSDAQCGLTVAGQRVMVMGVDDTDAYTCYALAAAGALPPDRGVQRIGLIYDVSSPNARFRTAVVLREANGIWKVDSSVAGRFDDIAAGKSLPALCRALH